MEQLAGRVALVTGAAGGIGLGIARACAERGMKVALADIDELELDTSVADLRLRGADVMAVPLDVADRDGWARAARDVPKVLGPVQLLVNNAGVSTLGLRFEEITPEMWDRVVSINLTGVYNGVRAFVGGMRAAGGGHIVNTSSMGGLLAGTLLAPYAATKSGVVGLSEALRLELSDDGIGVSVLCPGVVRSRLWRTSRALRGLPDTDTAPDDGSGQTARAAMDGSEVGRRVLAAVEADEPYIITHPEYAPAIIDRHRRLLYAFERAEEYCDG
jgi:NAD(P)-dependent dehydrogenase (short-subunit alcohol dehydrogenase family)